MEKPLVLWIDMLAAGNACEVPPLLEQRFNVRKVPNDENLQNLVGEASPLCIFYDCDYPDHARLERIRRIKEREPSVPFVLTTLQHSEALAVWTFRQGSLDYFVKPAPLDELHRCVRRLEEIAKFRKMTERRQACKVEVHIPDTISRRSQSATDRLGPAIYFVQQNYNQHVYSDAVARRCGLTPTYFSKAFRQRYGMAFQEFLLRYRVAQACLMLENPEASVSDVCYAVGFRDPSYFSRVFKRYLGSTPSEYTNARSPSLLATEVRAGLEEPDTSTSQVVRNLAGHFAG